MLGARGGRAPRQPWWGQTVPHMLGAADLQPGWQQTHGTGAGRHWGPAGGCGVGGPVWGGCLGADLHVGVLDAVVHQHHHQDGNGHPKVPNEPPDLGKEQRQPSPSPTAWPPPDQPCPPKLGSPQGPMQCPRRCPACPTHPSGEEPAVLELAQEEGNEEGASHEHQ